MITTSFLFFFFGVSFGFLFLFLSFGHSLNIQMLGGVVYATCVLLICPRIFSVRCLCSTAIDCVFWPVSIMIFKFRVKGIFWPFKSVWNCSDLSSWTPHPSVPLTRTRTILSECVSVGMYALDWNDWIYKWECDGWRDENVNICLDVAI